MSNFIRNLGKSQRSKDPVEIASVAIYSTDGHLLFLKRNDNEKWTLPGGHLENGESPEGGARREAKEEAGIDLPDLTRLGEGMAGAYLIHAYRGETTAMPDHTQDPDAECSESRWVDVKEGLPPEIADNLHSPKNITLRLLGLQSDKLDKSENTFVVDFIREFVNNVTEWSGAGVINAAVVPSLYQPGQLVVHWFDEYGFLGKSQPTPSLQQVAQIIQEQLGLDASPAPGILDIYAKSWANIPAPLVKGREIARLLENPDPSERSMAFKLSGIQPTDIAQALTSSDPVLQRAGFDHPGSNDNNLLMLLMRLKDRYQLQDEALSRSAIQPHHLHALYNTLNLDTDPASKQILARIAAHDQLDRELWREMWDNPMCAGSRRPLIRHAVAPPDVLEQVVASALTMPEIAPSASLARDALRHPSVPIGAVAAALKSPQLDFRVYGSECPDLTPDLIADVLTSGSIPKDNDSDAQCRANVLKGWNVQRQHLDTALRDVHHDVRAAVFESPSADLSPDHVLMAMAMKDYYLVGKALKSRVALPEHHQLWAAQNPIEVVKSEVLVKNVNPTVFSAIAKATDPKGRDLVDHKGQLTAHPDIVQPFVDNYQKAVLQSPISIAPLARSAKNSISRKVILGTDEPIFGEPTGVRYMIKPYHEKISRLVSNYQKHPHQGWAEITNQAMYHAGGIGHLHQKVHVAEHNMGPGYEKEPALVVRMEPGFHTLQSMDVDYDWPDHTKQDARKVTLMDFATNNLDRHPGNLMFNPDTKQLLTIDHPRSLQYVLSAEHKLLKNGWLNERASRPDVYKNYDSIGHYHKSSAINEIDPWFTNDYDDRLQIMRGYEGAFDWWRGASPKVRAALTEQLKHIKDPLIKEHIARNFESRASMLDDIAKHGVENFGDEWYKDATVPMHLAPRRK